MRLVIILPPFVVLLSLFADGCNVTVVMFECFVLLFCLFVFLFVCLVCNVFVCV